MSRHRSMAVRYRLIEFAQFLGLDRETVHQMCFNWPMILEDTLSLWDLYPRERAVRSLFNLASTGEWNWPPCG